MLYRVSQFPEKRWKIRAQKRGAKGMRIVITGNMGFVGPVVVKRLREVFPGGSLIGLDTGYFGGCIAGADRLPETLVNVQYFRDVREVSEEIFERADAVVHLAGISNDPIGNQFEEVTKEINRRASKDIAQMAKRAGVKRFIFASSCSMYGAASDTARTEDSPLNPLTAYARSKAEFEDDLRNLVGNGFQATCLRFSTACGWSERLRLDLVLNDFVACAVTSGEITILSDGTPWRPLINVRDMARAVEWAVTRDDSRGGSFLAVNVGSEEWNYQVRDLADAVAKAIPGVKVSVNKNAAPDKRSYRVSFNRFRELAPKHQPQVDLIESILELKDGMERIHFKNAEFRDSDFMRLKHLKRLQSQGLIDRELRWVKRI
jgi:nucleoside-diphosphate-sugar epimerase